MNITQSVDEMKLEIDRIQAILISPSTVICTHIICDGCKEALRAETEERATLQIKLGGMNELYNKIKQYGSNE